jgi:hypothetical protein
VPVTAPEPKTREPKSPHRRAALVATAVTVPLVVVLALLFSLGNTKDSSPKPTTSASGHTGPLPAVTVAAPPSDASAVAPCTKVLEQLPTSLSDLPARVVHPQPDSPFVVAWGDPPIVLRCGVARPAGLHASSSADTITSDGVVFLVGDQTNGDNAFTAVDRDVYVEVTVPTSYDQPPLGPLADAIAKALPAICTVPAAPVPSATPVPTKDLCTRRP